MSRDEIIHCFRCGDPFSSTRDGYYCVRGNMYLSEMLTRGISHAFSTPVAADAVPETRKSHFRCVRCCSFMTKMDERGLEYQCSKCSLRYPKQMVMQMIELHAHNKFLEPGQSSKYVVVVLNGDGVAYEHLAEKIQTHVRVERSKARKLAETIKEAGHAVIFTGHPQEAELIATVLKAYGIKSHSREFDACRDL